MELLLGSPGLPGCTLSDLPVLLRLLLAGAGLPAAAQDCC